MFRDPSFYVFLSFVVFCAVVGRPLLRMGLGFLDEKIEGVTQQLEQARLQREEAQTQLNNAKMLYHKELRYAEDIVEQAKLAAEEHQKIVLKELKSLMEKRTLIAKNTLEVQKSHIVSQFRQDVALAVNKLVTQVLKEKRVDFSEDILKSITLIPKA